MFTIVDPPHNKHTLFRINIILKEYVFKVRNYTYMYIYIEIKIKFSKIKVKNKNNTNQNLFVIFPNKESKLN